MSVVEVSYIVWTKDGEWRGNLHCRDSRVPSTEDAMLDLLDERIKAGIYSEGSYITVQVTSVTDYIRLER